MKSIGYTFPDIFLGEQVGSSQQTAGQREHWTFPVEPSHSVAVSLDDQGDTEYAGSWQLAKFFEAHVLGMFQTGGAMEGFAAPSPKDFWQRLGSESPPELWIRLETA